MTILFLNTSFFRTLLHIYFTPFFACCESYPSSNPLCETCLNTEIFLVHIFSHWGWIRRDTKYLSVFSPNAGKYRPEKTSSLDTFHAVILFISPLILCEESEKVKNQYLLAINDINGNFLCAMPVKWKSLYSEMSMMAAIAVVNNRIQADQL